MQKSNLPIHPNPSDPTMPTRLFSASVSLFLPCKCVHLYHFSRCHMYVLIYYICVSLSYLLHSVWQTVGPSVSPQMTQFHFFFYGWVMPHCMEVPHLLYSFVYGCFSCYHILAVVNCAAVNIGVHVSFWIMVLKNYYGSKTIEHFHLQMNRERAAVTLELDS